MIASIRNGRSFFYTQKLIPYEEGIVANHMKTNLYYNMSFQDVITLVFRDFHINEEKDVISFNCYFIRKSQKVVTNIVSADIQSKKPEVQSCIDRLNELYSQIINIKDHLIKP